MPRRSIKLVRAEFEQAQRDAKDNQWDRQIKCADNPGPWMDYKEQPTPDEANALCDGCPLRALCREYALTEIPTRMSHGVWGGVIFNTGKVVGRPGPQTGDGI